MDCRSWWRQIGWRVLLPAVLHFSPLPPACPAAATTGHPSPHHPPSILHTGGDQIRILNWVFRRGALAANVDYPYLGINDFCRTDVAQKTFKGAA